MKEYFSHDYNARNDAKLVSLRMKHGLESLAIYWCMVEMLYENEGRIYLDHIETIAFELHTESKRIENVLKHGDLFKFKKDYFYSDSVNERLKVRKAKRDKAKESAVIRWNRERERAADAMRTHSDGNAIKVKKSKVKEIKKEKYAEFVKLTKDEYHKLLDQYGESRTKKAIEKLDNYKGSKGKTYKSDYRAILSWVMKEIPKEKNLPI